MTSTRAILELHDLDLLLGMARDVEACEHLGGAGARLAGASVLDRDRSRLLEAIERRWSTVYERSLGRYGVGIELVRERVCQGCYVTLPTSASPPTGECGLHLCSSCGRLLYWR